jgi:hypothetical protein
MNLEICGRGSVDILSLNYVQNDDTQKRLNLFIPENAYHVVHVGYCSLLVAPNM